MNSWNTARMRSSTSSQHRDLVPWLFIFNVVAAPQFQKRLVARLLARAPTLRAPTGVTVTLPQRDAHDSEVGWASEVELLAADAAPNDL